LSATSTFSNFSRGFDSYTGDGTSSIILWGAQVEQRSALTDYTATTTQPITNYVPALQTAASGEPRFDHDPITGESKGFLIEEQRTNLVTYSEQFDNAAWTKSNSSITANTVVAPDGTLTGDKLIENTANDEHQILQDIAFSTGLVTVSLFVKAAERSVVRLFFSDFVAGAASALFDLSAETVTTSTSGSWTNGSAKVEAVSNGWKRLSFTAQKGAGTNIRSYIALQDGSSFTYTGDGYSGIYIWGAQLEAGSFPTSYIPTVASQVTRSADAASMTGTNFSSWYRQDEGTVFVEAGVPDTADANRNLFTVSNGTSSNRIRLYLQPDIAKATSFVVSGGQVQASVSTTISDATSAKVAIGTSLNNFGQVSDGGAASTDTSFIMPQSVSEIKIGLSVASSDYLNGHIKKLAFWPKRLSNATLQALTEE
jgi:hypothetical protein